ncbi:hypothetical protein [Janthinobacterium sp. LB3P112]|uniref:hypothetical protein n=1 Tax=Janthinobacterium sp. LB3P112 TaxID=3424196 RepID=UPI003F271691
MGVTSAAFAHLPASSAAGSWTSSYEVLTSLVPAVDRPLTVLDLACGDGHLLGLLAARRQPRLQLLGVDMNQAELPPLRFGDRRTGSQAGWRELLDGAFTHVAFDDIDVPWSPAPDELWAALTDTYDIDRLEDDARQRWQDRHRLGPAPGAGARRLNVQAPRPVSTGHRHRRYNRPRLLQHPGTT